MSLTAYNTRSMLHPSIPVRAGGWTSDVGTLNRHGWIIETHYKAEMMATALYFRHPTNNMVGQSLVGDVEMAIRSGRPIAYFGEQVLIKAEFYREMQIPRVELYEAEVGIPRLPTYSMEGDDNDWMIYSADRQSESIIVTPESVPMLLEEIRKAQLPRAKEILHSQRKREVPEIQTMAKILAFG